MQLVAVVVAVIVVVVVVGVVRVKWQDHHKTRRRGSHQSQQQPRIPPWIRVEWGRNYEWGTWGRNYNRGNWGRNYNRGVLIIRYSIEWVGRVENSSS